MLVSLFRSRYPQGCLISELLQFEQGKYVVRVTVQGEGTVLGTGLGAAETVEEAEDRARERALELLSLESRVSLPASSANGMQSHLLSGSPAMTVASSFSEEEEKKEQKKEKPRSPSLAETAPPSPPVVPDAPDLTTPVTPSPPDLPQPSESSTAFEEEASTMESPDPEPILPDPEPQFDFPPAEPEPVASSPESVEPPPTPRKTPTEPIDFSETLAQTNIELKRLGWTQKQGREFLIERYGKRSRQFLDDGELLDFLEYLKAQ